MIRNVCSFVRPRNNWSREILLWARTILATVVAQDMGVIAVSIIEVMIETLVVPELPRNRKSGLCSFMGCTIISISGIPGIVMRTFGSDISIVRGDLLSLA